MGTYIARRTLISVPTLIIISAILYLILFLAPGEPLAELANNENVTPEVREQIRKNFGLDQPWYIQYFRWASSLLRGDWGFSFSARVDVNQLIMERLPNTLWVVGIAYIIAVILAIPIGVISAVKQYSFFDQIITTLVFFGLSIPSFFLGLLLIIVLSIKLKLFPFIYDSTLEIVNFETFVRQIKQIVLPIIVLSSYEAAILTRYTRSAILDNLPQDYVRTARSKGLSETTIITRHILRNSMIPVVTMIALQIPNIFTGAIITEQIFRINGIGELLIRSITSNDIPVVMAITFVYSILVIIFTLLADILYGFLDPRIKYN